MYRLIGAMFLLTMFQSPALAGACDARAAALSAQTGGKVLSASSVGNKCRIRLLIPSSKGPPKRKTFVVSK